VKDDVETMLQKSGRLRLTGKKSKTLSSRQNGEDIFVATKYRLRNIYLLD